MLVIDTGWEEVTMGGFLDWDEEDFMVFDYFVGLKGEVLSAIPSFGRQFETKKD